MPSQPCIPVRGLLKNSAKSHIISSSPAVHRNYGLLPRNMEGQVVQKFRNQNLVVLGLVAFGIGMRVLPYVLERTGLISLTDPSQFAWNISPVPAMCLLGGAYFSRRWAGLMLGLVAYLISDLLIAAVTGRPAFAFYSTLPFVYVGFVLHGIIGLSLRGKKGAVRVGLTALVSEVAFFLVTNLGEWAIGDMHYPHTPAGLATCFMAALPFLYRSIYGTLIYSAIFFEVAAAVERRSVPTGLALAPAPQRKG